MRGVRPNPHFRRIEMLNDHNGHRVLVVDDNEDLAVTTALILRLHGHTSDTAFNGREALDRARTLKPDIVLLDMSLPDGDGTGIARTLRLERYTEGLRIIVISACELDAISDPSEAVLFDDYLLKPVSMEDLLRRLSCPDDPRAGAAERS